MSRKTADGLADTYQLEDRGDVALKGIEKPIAVTLDDPRDATHIYDV